MTRTLAGTPAGVSPLGIGSSRFTKTEVTKTRITHFQSGSPEMIISGFISTSIPYFLALCVLLRTQYRDTYNDLQWSPNFVPSTFSPIIYSPSWFSPPNSPPRNHTLAEDSMCVKRPTGVLHCSVGTRSCCSPTLGLCLSHKS